MTNKIKINLKQVLRQDFDAHWAWVFFLLELGGAIVLLRKPLVLYAFIPFMIVPLAIIATRYFALRKMMKNGVEISAKAFKLLEPMGGKNLKSLSVVDSSTRKGLYFVELKYKFDNKEFDIAYRFRHLKYLPPIVKGEDITIIVDPIRPDKILIRDFWIEELKNKSLTKSLPNQTRAD
jgi:hypothetical protein